MNGGKDLKKNKLDWDYEEQEKFDQLYNAYSKLMYYIAFDVLKDESLAQDAVQEAFINISKSFSKIKEKDCQKLKGFIVVVIRRVAINMYNKRKRNNVVSFEELYEKGYRGVLFDIDNTLVPHGAPADERAKKLFARLKEIGFSCCLISNNQEPRVKMFNEEIQVPYIYNAHKPSTKNYRKAMELMGTDEKNSLFVGDQLFTDVFGAKRAGMHNILVKPMHPKEEIQIVLKRYLERIVLHFYKKKQNKPTLK